MLEKEDKIIHVQGVLHQRKIDALKEKTGETAVKDALTVAVDAYLDRKKPKHEQEEK